jgi:Glycosyltransferases involved in cell wall biogenesis
MRPSISVITPVYNGASTIADCLKSIGSQTQACEHIVVDGASNDNTLEVVKKFRHVARVISEPDKGIYDAMNKGIADATGDIVGVLNADDFYIDDQVLAKVADAFDAHPVDAVFADMVYVRPQNLDKIIRYYSGANFSLGKFAYGWMPPHPTFFVKRECYLKYGYFKVDYRIAADFELLARFMVKHRISYYYLPRVIIKMRTGGVSTRNFNSNLILNREVLRACKENGVATNMLKIYSKYLIKCMQLVSRPA